MNSAQLRIVNFFRRSEIFGAVIALGAVVVLETTARVLLPISSPSAIYLTAIVYAASSNGWRAGAICALLLLLHAIYFFSASDARFTYAPDNATRLLMLALSVPVIVFLVGALKRGSDRAVAADKANAVLHTQLAASAERERLLVEANVAKQQIANILENISDAFVALDNDWRYTYVNSQAAQTFGRTREQLIGKHIWTEFPEGIDQPFYKAYHQAVETQQPIFLEEYYPPYDRWFENRIYPSQDGLAIFFSDVTERKRAEAELRRQNKFITALADTTPAIIYVYDLGTQSNVYANNGIARLLGYTPAQVQALGAELFARLIHPDDLATVIAFQSKILAAQDQDVLEIEYRMRQSNGAWRWFHSYERPFLRNPAGALKQKIGFAIDVTERKRVEAELQRNARVLRLFVEHSPAAIAMFDREMRYIVASRRYLHDYNLGEQDLVGRSHYAVFPEMPERWKEIHRRCLAGAIETADADPFPRADGSLDWVRWEIHPWYERNGDIGGIILFSEVITERKIVEEKLRESEARYRLLFHRSPVGVVQYDAHLIVTDCNERFVELLDTNRERVIGLDIHNLRDQGGLPAFEKSLQGEAGMVENLYQATTSNVYRWLITRTAPLFDSAGRVRGGVATVEDIDQRKRAEEEIRALNTDLEQRVITRTAELEVAMVKAREADRLKSAFLATMSHELRTPLNSIIGFTGILLQGLAGALNAEQIKQMTMVRDSARHLLELINDVLDLSKIEAGQIEIQRAPFDLRAAIERVRQGVAPLAEKKGLALNVQIAPEVNIIISDRRRVEQILINLVNNAIKFTERGSVRVECATRAGEVITRVIDTGIGIARADQGALFQPFRQIDTGLTRRHDGTGLGLSICKRLVELLDGKIWVESEPGAGSTFAFALPLEIER